MFRRVPIVKDGKRHALFDAEWRDIYRARVDDFTATLKASGARIYWMELPVMRSPRFGADMEQFNEIFEDRAAANGVAFVKTEGRLWRGSLRAHAALARRRRHTLHHGGLRTSRRPHCRCDTRRSRRYRPRECGTVLGSSGDVECCR